MRPVPPARRVLYALVMVAAIAVIAVVLRARQDRRMAEMRTTELDQQRAEVMKIIEQAIRDAGQPTKPAAGDYDTNWSLRNGAKPPPNSN